MLFATTTRRIETAEGRLAADLAHDVAGSCPDVRVVPGDGAAFVRESGSRAA
jgi:hypothetical protein